jgi:hypothetical protein
MKDPDSILHFVRAFRASLEALTAADAPVGEKLYLWL